MEYNRAQLKQAVRRSMKNTNPKPMLMTLLYMAVMAAGSWFINTVLGIPLTGSVGGLSSSMWLYLQQGYEPGQALYIVMLELFRRGAGAMFSAVVGSSVLAVIVGLWQSIMGVGYAGYCLSMVRNENPSVNQLFGALSRPGPVLLTRFLTGIFETLWSLLVLAGCAAILAVTTMLAAAMFLFAPFLANLLLWVNGALLILGIRLVTMRYALVDFLLVDRGLSGMDAIRESKRLMRGNIGRGFLFQLSFIGWELLALAIIWAGIAAPLVLILSQLNSMEGLAAAIGAGLLAAAAAGLGFAVLMLWLQPYMNGGWAKFYDWVSGTPDSLGGGSAHNGGGYNWTAGPKSGTGIGSDPSWGNGGQPPKRPKPKDDLWD